MTRGRPGEAAGGPALCGRGAHGVEGFLGAPRGFLWRDSSSRSHRHGDGRGPLARGLSSLEPGPGTRSRGVRKSRGGAVTAPVLSRPPSPGGGSSAGAGDAAPSSVPSVPGGGCRPVGRGCGCSGHCPPIFGGSEQPNVLLKVVVVRVRDPQAVPRPQDGCWWNKVKDNFSESPNHRDSVAVQLLRTARLVQNSILCAPCACSSFEMKLGRPVFHVTCGTCWAESPPHAPVGSVALPQPRQHRGVRWTRCWRSQHRQS
ncbi:uncharacterized protein LOC135575962 isoform X2 [Columba livia]|uniref:uncharacterized protein LOC135575962 isoform X2 n=1 Tax=Columba livia TaxID=8932 RepID=UPI0031BA5EE9